MRLSAREKQILEVFRERIDRAFPGEVLKLTLFGSKARGDATEESDIDLLVVTRSDDWRLGDRIRELGYLLELEHGLVLSIQVIGQLHLGQLKKVRTQFLEALEQDGIAV